MTTLRPPLCANCSHLYVPGPTMEGPMACEAFPDGIPNGIILNEINHREPVAGDNGITFDPLGPDDYDPFATSRTAES